MKKYAVKKTSFTFDPSEIDTVKEAFDSYGDEFGETVSVHDSLDEARAAAEKLDPSVRVYDDNNARADVIYIEEGDYDFDEDTDEWEFVSGADIWDVNCEEIYVEVEEKEDFEVLATALRGKSSYSDPGYIVRYDGELYFVLTGEKRKDDIRYCKEWRDVERRLCFEEIDTEVYRYYSAEDVMREIDFERI